MRIGIDLTSAGTSESGERRGADATRRLALGLLGHDRGHAFVLYGHQGSALRGLPSLPHATLAAAVPGAFATPAERLELVARSNPDHLDWLLLPDPFAIAPGQGPPIRPRESFRLAAVVGDLEPLHAGDLRAARAVTRLRQYDALLVPTEADRAELASMLVLSPDRISVIGWAGDRDTFGPERSMPMPLSSRQTLAALGLRRAFVLGLAGRRPWDAEAIRAAHRALPDRLRRDVPLVLVGAMADSKPEAGVIALASPTEATWRVLCQNAAACLFPSCGAAPLVEAMLCGAAIVAGAGGARTELLGNAGLIADPHDPIALSQALMAVLEDWTLSQRLRRRALDRARLCTDEVVAGRLLEALGTAIRTTTVRVRVDHAHLRKPRVAVVSASSADDLASDGDFSRLLAVLRATYAIDLYHADDLDPPPSSKEGTDLRPFARNEALAHYHAVLYRSGPALAREAFLTHLRRRPGLVMLNADDLASIPRDGARREVLRRVFVDALAVALPSPWCAEQVEAWLPENAGKAVVIATGSAPALGASEAPAWPQSAALFVALLERCASASRPAPEAPRAEAPGPHQIPLSTRL